MSEDYKGTRVVVAADSFKGSLTAKKAASIIADVLADELSSAEIIQCPLADGGEGTKVILEPYMTDGVCLIESAQFVGLNLPEMASLDVMNRSSTPLGDTMLAGLDMGERDFVIGLGGSATNDCGLGMLMALGMHAVNHAGDLVQPTLAGLLDLASVDTSALNPRLNESRLTILSDVVSPLCGKNGATAVYGPQKGVQAEDVERIDQAMELFALKCRDIFGSDMTNMPGAGAAGGLGFALMILGGEMVSGAEYVMNKTGFHNDLMGADWVITGEGCSDAQTLQGKLPLKVAQAARESGAKAALISGTIDLKVRPELEKVFDLVISAKPDGMDVEQAVAQAESLLIKAVRTFCANSSLLF